MFLSVGWDSEEFERASRRPLASSDRTRMEWWVDHVLAEARRVWGPLYLTSFVRETGSHATGWAVDIQPVLGDDARVRRIADWFAARFLPTGTLAQVIYEPPEAGQKRAHVHLAARLIPGATAGYLVETEGRRYASVPIPALDDVSPLIEFQTGALGGLGIVGLVALGFILFSDLA